MPVGQTCGACGVGGHNRRTCASDIGQLMKAVDASFDELDGLLIKDPRRVAHRLREHMTRLVDDRDEALVRAEWAETKLAQTEESLFEAQARIRELEASDAAKDETIQRLTEFLHRLRGRNEAIVDKVRHLRAV
ncbi:hypothetical protein ACI782_06765 [Geodermatophilus sp. SYSU D00703]